MTELARNLIREHGLKATPQRISIYDSMVQLEHASADMVFEKVKEDFPKVTVATIYNVLDSFCSCGILARRCTPTNKMFFDVVTENHFHFYNIDNETFTNIGAASVTEVVRSYLALRGYEITSIDVQVNGRVAAKKRK